MATKLQRARAILEAIRDNTVTNAHLGRVLDAYAFTYERDATLTNGQKAAVFIRQLRKDIREIVRDSEESQAAATAIDTVRGGEQIDIGDDDDLGEQA